MKHVRLDEPIVHSQLALDVEAARLVPSADASFHGSLAFEFRPGDSVALSFGVDFDDEYIEMDESGIWYVMVTYGEDALVPTCDVEKTLLCIPKDRIRSARESMHTVGTSMTCDQ